MKKFIVVLVLLCAVLPCVFADAIDPSLYAGVINTAFKPELSSRDSGVAWNVYGNPASLANAKVKVQLPSVSATMYNISSAMKDEDISKILSEFTHFNFKNWQSLLVGMLGFVGSGYNGVLGADVGVLGLQIKHFGFSLDAQAKVHTMPKITDGKLSSGSSITSLGVVPEINAGASIAIGFRVLDRESFSIDAGIAARFAYRVFSEQVTVDTFKKMIGGDGGLDVTVYSGWGIPVDAGLRFNFIDEKLSVEASVTNLNGYYYMKQYDGIDNIMDILLMKSGSSVGSLKLYTPWSLNAGVVIDPHWKVFNPVFSFDFTDIYGYIKEDIAGKKPFVELFTHLNIRANFTLLRTLKVINISAAFKYGYPEFGLGVGISGTRVELLYGWKEMGSSYGEKPVDYLTLRVKLGFDNN